MKKIIFWIILLLGLAASLIWAFRPRPIPVELTTVRRGPYEQQVAEDGKTRAREVYKIYSPASGNLRRVERHSGDRVEKDQLLAVITRPPNWDIRSPVAGKILRVARESDGPIERGDLVMEVADSDALEIVAEILTEEAVGIKPGMPVRIESGGHCQPMKGKVRLVEPSAFTKISALGVEEQRVNVIVDFDPSDSGCEGIADGFQVRVFVILQHFENALTVPTGALFRQGEGWSVFRVENGKALLTPIRTSRRNQEQAMVEGGLSEGEVVILYPADEIQPGTRVRGL